MSVLSDNSPSILQSQGADSRHPASCKQLAGLKGPGVREPDVPSCCSHSYVLLLAMGTLFTYLFEGVCLHVCVCVYVHTCIYAYLWKLQVNIWYIF